MIKVIIYGTGTMANFLLQYIKSEVEIVAYVDSFNYGQKINGIPVILETDIKNYSYDYIVIAFSHAKRGIEKLKECNVDADKIIAYMDEEKVEDVSKAGNEEMHKYVNDSKLNTIFNLSPMNYHSCFMMVYKNYDEIIEQDYVREQTLALLYEEIKRKEVKGAVAELGVYRGEFSKKINYLFRDRDFYLFDTFEGFSKSEVSNDTTTLSNITENNKFKDTNVQKVLDSMPFPEKCIIKKGYFPETFDLSGVRFSFVSIDVDLEDPIYSGLEIFYPLLEKGGYIVVHDYNNEGYGGTKKAVINYCSKNNISYVPLSDRCGSIVITK